MGLEGRAKIIIEKLQGVTEFKICFGEFQIINIIIRWLNYMIYTVLLYGYFIFLTILKYHYFINNIF